MKLSNIIGEELIALDVEAKDKTDALNKIFEIVKNTDKVKDIDLFKKQVLKRERMMSTGIGNGIAIPHAKSEAVSDILIVIARLKKGVDFQALDDKPVNLIFLVGASASGNPGQYIHIMAHLSKLLKDKTFRQALMECKTEREIVMLLDKEEV